MPWVRLDDGWWTHPKVLRVEPVDRLLWITAMSWSSQHGTDGKIPRHALPAIAAMAGVPKVDEASERLVEAGLLELDVDGWVIHQYLDYQLSAQQIEERRAIRADAGRRGGVASAEARGSKRSKPEANGQANPKQTASTVAKQTATPSHPIPSLTPPSSSSSARAPEPQTEPVDDDDRIAAAITELGQHDHRQAKADGVRIRNPVKHLAACIEGRARDRPDLRRLARQHPEWTATQLAQRIRDPVTVPSICPDCNRVGGHHASTCPTRGDP